MSESTPQSNPDELSEQRTIAPGASRPTLGAASQQQRAQGTMPEVLGRYTIKEVLGRGAMGAVYLAHDTDLNRKVALKTPLGPLAEGEDFLERFRREAQAAAVLRHQNICPIYDVGEIDGIHHISMAFIEGSPLSSYVNKDDPLAIRRAVLIVRKVASALAEAHRHEIIHRDLKPANIMMDGKGEPIVMDFGLARIETPQGEQLTQDGVAMGSPAYMSPEQFEGKSENMGASCDIYSLGVVLYELLTGELPFRGSVLQIMAQVLKERTKRPSTLRPEIDEQLDAICMKMMHREAGARFGSMKAVVAALTKYLKAEKKPAPPPEPEPAPPADEWDSPEEPQPARRRKKKKKGIRIGGKKVSPGVLAAGGGIAVVLAGILWVVFGGGSEPPAPDQPPGDTIAVEGTGNAEGTATVGVAVNPDVEPAGPVIPNLDDAILLFNFEPDSYFEEEGKQLLRDLSGLDNHGEMHGPTPTEHGKAGTALRFDGRNDYVDLPQFADDLVQDTTELTVALWFQQGDIDVNNYLLDVRSTDGRISALRMGAAGGEISFLPGTDLVRTPVTLAGQWHHLVGTWKGELRHLYLDGKPVAERIGATTPINNPQRLLSRIGGQATARELVGPRGERRALSGTIDEMVLLRRAMSAEEIGQLYQLGVDGISLSGPKPTSADTAPHVPTQSDGQLQQGLVAWYRFDEAQGRDVSDSGPSGHNATATADIKRVPGVAGNAIEIDQDTYIPIGDVAGFDWNEPFTLCAWIRPNSLRDNQSIVRRRNATSKGYTMMIRRKTLGWGASAGITRNMVGAYASEGSVVPGQWSHVAIAYDGSGRQRSLAMYVNGRPVRYTNTSGTLSKSIRIPEPATIGESFDGQLDDVRIYNRILSREEVDLLATPPVVESVVTAVASADVVCAKLTKAGTPEGLHPDASAYTTHVGWPGFQLQLPDWKAWSGTQVQLDYRHEEGSNGLLIVHPLRFGHLCVRVRPRDAHLYMMPSFPMDAPPSHPIERLPAYHRTFPLIAGTTYRVVSQMDETGNVEVAINGRSVYRVFYPPNRRYVVDGARDLNRHPGRPVRRFKFLPDALVDSKGVARKWLPGMAGVLYSPGESDSTIQQVRIAQTTPDAPCPVTDEQLRDGLVAWYRFDETEQQRIVDSATGTQRDVTQLPLKKVDGMVGSAVEKEEKGAIWIGDIADFEWNEPFSLSAWIYPFDFGTTDRMIFQNHDWGILRGYILQLQEGKLVCNISSSRTNRIDLFSGPNQIPIGEWTHVAIAYDGTGRRHAARMFLDGREESYAIGKDARLTDTIKVDGLTGIGGNFLGRLDDVRIYNRALSNEEVEFLAAPDMSAR